VSHGDSCLGGRAAQAAAPRQNDALGETDVSGASGVSQRFQHRFPWQLGSGEAPPAARAILLTTDHKAAAPAERARIVAAGGFVDAGGRVGGAMEVSRSFGDAALKRTNGKAVKDPAKCAINADPDIKVRLSLEAPRDELLILACDGLWTRFNTIDAAQFVRCRVSAGASYDGGGARHDWTLEKVAKALVDDCVNQKNGTDNTSVLILQFHAR